MPISPSFKRKWPLVLSTVLIAVSPFTASAQICEALFGPERMTIEALENLPTKDRRLSSLKEVEINSFDELKRALKAIGLEAQPRFDSPELNAQVFEFADSRRVVTLYVLNERMQQIRQTGQPPFTKADIREILGRVSTLRPNQSYEFTKHLDLEQFRFNYLVVSPSRATRFNDRSELHRLLRTFGLSEIRVSKVAEHLGDITIWTPVVTYQNRLTNQRITFTIRPETQGTPPQVYEDPGQVIGLLRRIHDALLSGENLNDDLYTRSQ